MSDRLTSGHTLQRYDQALAALNALVLEAGDKARANLHRALEALERNDAELARAVIGEDQAINALDRQVEEKVFQIIALQQPVAKDLRDLLAVDHMMLDIERIGDESRRLAHIVLYYHDLGQTPDPAVVAQIAALVHWVDAMVEAALRAFKEDDAALALEVLRRDAGLDNEMKAALRRLCDLPLDPDHKLEQVVEITLALRAVERVGRHAAHIARHVIFLITGQDVRHKPLEAAEAAVRAHTSA